MILGLVRQSEPPRRSPRRIAENVKVMRAAAKLKEFLQSSPQFLTSAGFIIIGLRAVCRILCRSSHPRTDAASTRAYGGVSSAISALIPRAAHHHSAYAAESIALTFFPAARIASTEHSSLAAFATRLCSPRPRPAVFHTLHPAACADAISLRSRGFPARPGRVRAFPRACKRRMRSRAGQLRYPCRLSSWRISAADLYPSPDIWS